MPHLQNTKEYNTFVKGLITEAGPLTFPDNASKDEDNFELNTRGYRGRRLGMDYENGYNLIPTISISSTFPSRAVSVFRWDNVNNDGALTVLCVQVGLLLWFFDASKSTVTDYPLNSGNPVSLGGSPTKVFRFSTISGNLIVVSGDKCAYQLVYDEDLDRVSYLKHGLLTRDIWGVSDEFSPDYRFIAGSGGDTDAYSRVYNLTNNGWGALSREYNIETSNRTYGDEFSAEYALAYGVQRYPNLLDTLANSFDSSKNFDFDLTIKTNTGSTPSPRGSLIIDIFDRGDSRLWAVNRYNILNNYYEEGDRWNSADGLGNKILGAFSEIKDNFPLVRNNTLGGAGLDDLLDLPTDMTSGGVGCVATYAGRVFYSGFNSEVVDGDNKSPNLGNYVFYSQVVSSPDQVGKCYQEGDPTGPEDFDLLETDGGSIKIPGMSSVLDLIPFGRSLLVLSRNGVWEIKGNDSSFSATNNAVEKVTNIGCTSADSIVVAEDRVIYWSQGGIYSITTEATGFNLIVQNITDGSIRTLYNSIPSTAKSTARGVYSAVSRKVSWIYNDSSSYGGGVNLYEFNRQLNLDLTLEAFYTFTFSTSDSDNLYPQVAGIFNSPNFLSSTYEECVFIGEEGVVIDSEDVVVGRRVPLNSVSDTKYLVIKPATGGAYYKFTVAALINPDFEDWDSDGSESQDAAAYMETGFEILQDSQRQKQVKYITCHLQRTEDGFDSDLAATSPSSCLMQAKWDFADSSNSGKIGTAQQVYRLKRDYVPSGTGDLFDYGQSVISTKNKVRGRGRALSLKFTTEPGKNCILYGWGVIYGINQDV